MSDIQRSEFVVVQIERLELVVLAELDLGKFVIREGQELQRSTIRYIDRLELVVSAQDAYEGFTTLDVEFLELRIGDADLEELCAAFSIDRLYLVTALSLKFDEVLAAGAIDDCDRILTDIYCLDILKSAYLQLGDLVSAGREELQILSLAEIEFCDLI